MEQPSIKKNYMYRLVYEVLALITPFITTPYVSRVLGADGIGIYSYTSSIMTYFTLFAALGTASYGTRTIAQHRDNKKETSKLFWEIELMTVFTSSVCLIVWIGVIIFNEQYSYYYIALLPTLLATMFNITWFFSGYEQIRYIVFRNILCKLLGIILLFLLVKEKKDLLLYMLINSSVVLLGNLSMWSYLPEMLEPVDMKSLRIKPHLKETIVYFIPTIATSIYTVLDKTLIGIITKDSYQNGYYEQATKIIGLLKTLVFTAVNLVMEARMSYLFSEKKYDEIRVRIKKSMNFILLLGFGCVFGILGVAKQFIPFFLGEGFEYVIPMLCIMSPLILIVGISNCLGSQYFTPSGQRKRSAKIIVFGSIVNLCLNLFLIPKFGANGAVVASVIAESVISILYVLMSNGYMTAKIIWECSYLRLIAGVVMLFVVILLGKIQLIPTSIILMLQVMCGIGVYGCLLLLFKDQMVFELLKIVTVALKKIFNRRI